VPVLSGISIALLAWLNGSKVAKLEINAEHFRKRRNLGSKPMKLTAALLLTLTLAACANSPPVAPTTLALCSETNVITFHAPLDYDPADPSSAGRIQATTFSIPQRPSSGSWFITPAIGHSAAPDGDHPSLTSQDLPHPAQETPAQPKSYGWSPRKWTGRNSSALNSHFAGCLGSWAGF
jgi:hypothetical protein